ncbi:MAG: DUF1801 domain-containing protein [Bacteroidota bacterium]
MKSKASTPKEYLDALPDDRKAAMKELQRQIVKHLPKGFKEGITYGMLGYYVPHSIYPAGYHVNPQHMLPFMNLGSQKNFIVLHHLGLYADKKLLEWFTLEYTKAGIGKLDMGKGCVRFKKMDQIPFALIGKLAGKMTVKDWIARYEKNLQQRKK